MIAPVEKKIALITPLPSANPITVSCASWKFRASTWVVTNEVALSAAKVKFAQIAAAMIPKM